MPQDDVYTPFRAGVGDSAGRRLGMRSKYPTLGNPWPHDMVISVHEKPTHILELLADASWYTGALESE